MGTVYLAQQSAPLKRQVAIKVIRRGLDTRSVVTRFEAERQALALMDHPAIARVFDAGETESGQLYFVMEFVDGQPITHFCDEREFSTRQRLELFVQVCDGVQHAHRKGVIHRDLKPSNVLVRSEGGQPAVKVIDFGVAKVVEPSLVGDGTVTQLDQMIGTPKYMSPEQAQLSPLGVDTRSDVYALGVLLYELLTGAHPFASERLESASFDEVRRIIREDEPTIPSDRFRSSDERTMGVARLRNVDAAALRRELQGDLDWIALRALEKDPTRRYPSPLDLAQDVRRHLADEPVEARPPGAAYRLAKFVRRHRVAVAGACGVLLALLVGVVVSSSFAIRASQQREAAERARADMQAVADFQASMLRNIDLQSMGRRLAETLDADNPTNTARSLVDREILARAAQTLETQFVNQPRISATLQGSLAQTYDTLGLFDKALPHLDAAIETRSQLWGPDDPRTLELVCQRGSLMKGLGRWDDSERDFRRCQEGRHRALGPDDPATIDAARSVCGALGEATREIEAAQCFEDVLAEARRVLGDQDLVTLSIGDALCKSYLDQRLPDKAESHCLSALRGRRSVLGPDDPKTILSMARLPPLYDSRGQLDEALATAKEIYEARRRVQGDEHLHTLLALGGVALHTSKTGDLAEAIAIQTEVVQLMTKTLGPNHHSTLVSLGRRGDFLRSKGDLAAAESDFRVSVEGLSEIHGDSYSDTIIGWFKLGRVQLQRGRLAESEVHLRRAVESVRETRPMGGQWLAAMQGVLATALSRRNRHVEAEALLLESIEELKAHPQATRHHSSVRKRLVELYEAWGQSDKAELWRRELSAGQ